MKKTTEIAIDKKEVITRFAQRIVDHGFSVPAIFFFESTKYMSFLGGQVLVFFGPLITAFVRSESYYNFAEVLEERQNVEFLITEIERLEQEKKDKK